MQNIEYHGEIILKNYVLSVKRNNKYNNATSKPREDIENILKDRGYCTTDIKMKKNFIFRLFSSLFLHLDRCDNFIVQYPTYQGRIFEIPLLKRVASKSKNTIVIVHDVDSLRSTNARRTFKSELKFLNEFSKIIVPTGNMKNLMIEYGIADNKILVLGIYDYLKDGYIGNCRINSFDKTRINFAGNLNKSKFLKYLPNNNLKFNLYGDLNDKSQISQHIFYKGSFSPEKIIEELDNGFGLVWDGSKCEKISGNVGEYLRYNSPHKVSLYLTSGLPVIVWKQSAISEFVRENNVGIVIDSIEEIEHIINTMPEKKIQEILKNVNDMSIKLQNGYYTKTVLDVSEL